MASKSDEARAYWRANIILVAILLTVWFLVAYVGGIFAAEALNEFRLGGFKLGFWIAQQGSIVVFVLLVFIYAWRMQRLDRDFHVDEPAALDEAPEHDVPEAEGDAEDSR